MAANEWLEVMKQAQDFPKGMEKLIVKYGEMLIAEHESKVKKLTIPDVMKSLPTTEDIEHFASNKRKQDWNVNTPWSAKLGNGASEYERGLIFGAKWMKHQIEGI